jgi:maltose alpha-D-glucosyltransferase/alpha-amylase
VDRQLADATSLPARTHDGVRTMLAVRRAHSALAAGNFQPLTTLDDRILAYVRSTPNQQVLVVQNLSNHAVNVTLPASVAGAGWKRIFGTQDLAQGVLVLAPKGFSWFAA